jgi:hypothetical protein
MMAALLLMVDLISAQPNYNWFIYDAKGPDAAYVYDYQS